MNRNVFSALLLAAVFSIALFSCKKETDNKYSEYSRAYFPLQIGHYVVYDVDTTLWDDFTQTKTLHHYQMRYTVSDTFRDNANRLSYGLDVHIRKTDTVAWQPHRVIIVTPTASNLEYSEDNVRFIKLVFPISDNVEWAGNALIPAGDQDYQHFQGWIYKYINFTQPFNNGLLLFDNTVTVEEQDYELGNPEAAPNNFATRTFAKEVYGYDVGMIYREMIHWEYQPSVAHFRKGYGVVMRAVEHN
jgi:hypothetical protein